MFGAKHSKFGVGGCYWLDLLKYSLQEFLHTLLEQT